MTRDYDVVIVGAGVTGTALLYTLSRYSNIGTIAMIEKNKGVAEVNSHPLNNAQTSHDGGTETNYSLAHALEVKRAATMLRTYVEQHKTDGLFRKTTRMVLGIGTKEIDKLLWRWREFRDDYPDLRYVTGSELAALEPMIAQGRDENEPIAALVSNEGYAINYQKLAESFVHESRRGTNPPGIFFDTKVMRIRKGDRYEIVTDRGTFTAKAIVFAAGAYSLQFAHMLGYAKHLGLVPISASFFISKKVLNGKVYRMPDEGIPFAAVHGDPDVTDESITRFGPTTKPQPLMEARRFGTFFDFIEQPNVSWRGFTTLMKIAFQKRLFGYVTINALYDLPVFGRWLFLKREAQKIVPTLRYRDIKLRRNTGGIRPQIINLKTGELEMGDKTIVGDRVIFNTTPSPGASVCLQNAERDAKELIKLMPEFRLDLDRLQHELGVGEKIAA